MGEWSCQHVDKSCGQSYQHFTIVNYDSRVVIWAFCSQCDSKVVNYDLKVLYNIDHYFKAVDCLSFFLSSSVQASGQSYKHFMLVNYDSRVIITCKLLILTTLES